MAPMRQGPTYLKRRKQTHHSDPPIRVLRRVPLKNSDSWRNLNAVLTAR